MKLNNPFSEDAPPFVIIGAFIAVVSILSLLFVQLGGVGYTLVLLSLVITRAIYYVLKGD